MDINEMTHVDTNYDSDQIQVLEGLEAVRKRPGMYIGSTGPRGLHHLVYEIVDNAIDEALAGYCDRIDVRILPGDIICVQDNGRGVPVGVQHQTGLPAVTVVYTILHAGGKFGGAAIKFPAVCTALALPSSMRFPRGWRSRCARAVTCTASASRAATRNMTCRISAPSKTRSRQVPWLRLRLTPRYSKKLPFMILPRSKRVCASRHF